MKKLISMAIRHFEAKQRLSFWKAIERRNTIKRLGEELEMMNSALEGNLMVSRWSFNQVYRIAKLQQKHLTKKQ